MSSAEPTKTVEVDDAVPDTEAVHDENRPEDGELEPSDANLSTPKDERPVWRRAVGLLTRPPIEVWILFFVATLTRFAFLYSPHFIVFDETYFRQYALEYKAHTYYFDLHPPLGKMLLGLWGAISGTHATAAGKDPAVVLRILPAACGVLLIIVVYYLIRRLSRSRRIATLGAGMLLLDNCLTAISRFTLMDSMLLLAGMLAVTLGLAARERVGRAQLWTVAGAATAAGFCLSIKVTGLTALGLLALLWLVDAILARKDLRAQWKGLVAKGAMIVVIPVLVYFVSFAVHFALLPNSGVGDGYMGVKFQNQLKGGKNFDPNDHMNVFQKFKDLNHNMTFYEHALDGSTHPNASKWYTWPISKRSVYLYLGNDDVGNGKSRYIYEIGNPAVWWGTILGAAIVLFGMLVRPKRFARFKWQLAFLALAWAANWFPFAFITRPMFLYHYFFALIFSLSFVALGLGALTGWIDHDEKKPFTFATRRSTLAYWSILGVALALFLYFGPTTYGTPISPQGLSDRLWLSTWR